MRRSMELHIKVNVYGFRDVLSEGDTNIWTFWFDSKEANLLHEILERGVTVNRLPSIWMLM